MSSRRVSAKDKVLVAKRANFCCEYCVSQSRYFGPFSIEHVRPLSKGGSNQLSNLALACQHCNNFKYSKLEDIDPSSGSLAPLYNPRQQNWTDHFAWNEDYSKIVGLTATGRATVSSLRLNRAELMAARKAFYKLKEHPP